MALIGVNQYQAPQQEKEESAMDKILKGMQIAGTVLGGYNTIKDIQLKGAQTDAANLDLAAKQRQEAGQYTPAEITKAGLEFTPKPNLLPGEAGDGLLPPQKAPADFEGALTKTPAQVKGAGGELLPGYLTDKDAKKELIARAQSLKNDVRQSNEIQIAEQQAGNYRNLISALDKGNPNGDAAATITAARMFNPGVMKAADGSIVGADSLPEEIKKHVMRAFGDPNFKLQPPERDMIRKIGKEFFVNAAESAKETQLQAAVAAVKLGVDPKSVGVGTYYDLLDAAQKESKAAGAAAGKKIDLSKMSDDEKYELYLKNYRASQKKGN